MGTVRILVIQPSRLDPPGSLGEWLTDAGAELDVIIPSAADLPANLDGYQALVVLGGEMGALDDADYPWLREIRGLLSQAVSRTVPVLAICLGAQLLAEATGGRVAPARNGPDAGTVLVAKRDAAGDDRLFGPVPLTPDVLQFRKDEIASLPPSARLLASSPRADNQAFRVDSCAYGLQFHIETSTDVVLEWARLSPEIAATAHPGQFEPDHLDAFHHGMAEAWQPLAQRFVEFAALPAEQRRTSRYLPLA
jgi:GMP synthase-like glutamine amidotransferase